MSSADAIFTQGTTYSVVLYDDTTIVGSAWDRRDECLILILAQTSERCIVPWDGIRYIVETARPERLQFGTMSRVLDE